MATEWIGRTNVITTVLPSASQLAAVIDPDVGGAETFTKGAKLRPIGSSDTTPTAWAASVPLRQRGIDIVQDALNGIVHPYLAERGVTLQTLQAALANMHVQVGLRETYDGTLLAFIAAHGYEVIPQVE